MARAGDRSRTLGVIPGSGGAGATTFAAAVALVSSSRQVSALVDLDPLGPGLDRVVGLDGSGGVRWDALTSSRGRLGSRSLREALPDKDGLAVLTWDVAAPADLDATVVREVLSATQRGNDLVVVDLPRTLDDVTLEVVTRCDRVLVVVDPTIGGVGLGGQGAGRAAPGHGAESGWWSVTEVRPSHPSRSAPPWTRLSSRTCLASAGWPSTSSSGSGPVHGRRSALARAARSALSLLDRRLDRDRRSREVAAHGRRGCRPTSSTTSVSSSPARVRRSAPRSSRSPCATGAVRSATPRCSPCTTCCARTSSAPARSSRCCAWLESPTSSSTVPTPSTSTAARAWSAPRSGSADDAAVRRLAQRLAGSVGRRLDDATPYADLRLPDGTRFHAVLAPLSRPGTVVSLRVPNARAFTLDELVDSGTVGPEGAALLQRIVASRIAFLVSGGTGTGKTTLLSALLSLADPAHRIVIVEDASELRPDHPHVVGLESRPANVEGAGEVPMRVLVRQALRMRPDRLVVGEVRGGEVTDLLAAMNTGHEGGCGTVHANSAADVPARIEALAMATGMTQQAVHSQLASAVEAVIHLARGADGARRVAAGRGARPRRRRDGLGAASGELRSRRRPDGARVGRSAPRQAAAVRALASLLAAAALLLLLPGPGRLPDEPRTRFVDRLRHSPVGAGLAAMHDRGRHDPRRGRRRRPPRC